MSAKRSASSDQLDPYEEYGDEFSGALLLDNWREGDVLCITPPSSFRRAIKPRPRHGQARVPEWVLHELERPICPSQSQRANDIITRHEERRNVARQMLQRQPSIPSPPSSRLNIRNRVQDEFVYSSDFTEDDEEDTPWARSTSRRVPMTNETSSGDEMLTSPDADDEDEDYEIKQLMKRRGRRFTKRTPTAQSTDLMGKQSRGDSRTAAKKPKAAESMVKDQVADGRNVIPHHRLLDPWKLPPIANLTRNGPVNLIHTTATNSNMTVNNIPIISASEEMLLKSIKAKTRRLRKLERRHKKKQKTENK